MNAITIQRKIFDLTPLFPFPKREQTTLTCGAHVIVSLLEYFYHNHLKIRVEPISLLHAYYYYAQLHDVTQGANPPRFFNTLKMMGFVAESEWPESPDNFLIEPPPLKTTPLREDISLTFVARYNEYADNNGKAFIHFVTQQLKKRNPVAISYAPTQLNLANLTPDSEYVITTPDDEPLEFHSVLIVGASSDRFFLIRDTAQDRPITYRVPFDYLADKRYCIEAYWINT